MVGHFYVKFGDSSCVGFWDNVQQTDRQKNADENPVAVVLGKMSHGTQILQCTAVEDDVKNISGTSLVERIGIGQQVGSNVLWGPCS